MAKPLLTLKDVHVRRGMSVVLDGCSVDVDSGQTVVLTGANGAGKSTTIKLLTGRYTGIRVYGCTGVRVCVYARGC